jgi:2-(1,2-epoxy-1,2-dihydrophenyl)acetyl-CoA isomerase
MELSMLAEKLPSEKALEWGLINRVYDDDKLMDASMTLAQKLAAGPTVALYLIRKAYWKSLDNTFEEQLHVESVYQQEASCTEDFLEGVFAFHEKRAPRFKGK